MQLYFFPSGQQLDVCVLSSRADRRHVGILFFTDHDFDSAMNFKSLYLLGWKHFALMCFILWYMQTMTIIKIICSENMDLGLFYIDISEKSAFLDLLGLLLAHISGVYFH